MTRVVNDGFSGIQVAEQTVSDAWIGQLLLAESEAETVVGACARVRERAAGRVRAAQRAGDLAALIRLQGDLEAADAGWCRAVADHERARAGLVRELSGWSAGIASRVREARADQQNAGRR
jgi:hypothetical protein